MQAEKGSHFYFEVIMTKYDENNKEISKKVLSFIWEAIPPLLFRKFEHR